VPFVETLTRTEPKRWHGPHASMRQAPYLADLPAPAPPMVLVVDDLVTSGRTMRNCIEAIRQAGAAAFGFAYRGC
jgi:predicted amidophosphoribosyltransferase